MIALIVIKPNSSQAVTDGIDAAMDPLRWIGIPIRCLTLAEGPAEIETRLQADLTVAPMLALAAAQPDAAGVVIVCFGDPGLDALRDRAYQPVLGIQEAFVRTALTLGLRFGVIAILPPPVPRNMRSFGAMGVLDRLAGDRPIGLGVADRVNPDRSLSAMIATGIRLRDEDGADVLNMGCAGMAGYRAPLQDATGLPVVEPSQAAVAMALGLITLNLSHTVKRPRHA